MNTSKVFFSIVIPFFNSGESIGSTIDSILCQTYSNWELLMIDDGSTDNSLEVVGFFSVKDGRIKVLKRENREKGANACRNIGIENASGEYIAFLDSDDGWKANRLEELHRFLVKNRSDGLYSGALVYDGYATTVKPSRKIRDDETLVDFLISPDSSASTPTLVVKKDLAAQVLFDERLKRHQDYDFFIRFGNRFGWTYFENFDVVINWRRGEVRNIHFASCIRFYETNAGSIRNSDNEFVYLFNMYINAHNRDPDASKYYHAKMLGLFSKVGFKKKVIALLPGIYLRLNRLKDSLIG